ncbi:hypothetical protein CPB83DRAFT_819338 [Crepidotus variabilis]|uniref:Uncharacterized protein n=1 Tax=Crepidotus variabilis TaxID=179855 RepID=A0A9P6E9L3_9AGAR|nr:hypothetical protein CPB83DRAFT_819338 [Crepidotus variabilis]
MRRLRCKGLTFLAAFAAFNLFIISEYIQPRKVALSLDLVYDPPTSNPAQDLAQVPFSSTPRVLLVSALFPQIDQSLSQDKVATWTKNFLGQIETDIYLYTTKKAAPSVHAARVPGGKLIVDTSFASPFDVHPLRGRRLVYERMRQLDPSDNPSAERYALRNAKPFFLERATQNVAAKAHYDYVFWVDFNAFSEHHVYQNWPDTTRLQQIWKEGTSLTDRRREDLFFFPVNDGPPKESGSWTEDLGPIDAHFAEGSFFGGPPSAVRWFASMFYAYHNHYLTLGFFIGQDDTIYNSLLLLSPSRFITVWASDPTAPARGGLPPSFVTHGPLGACGSSSKYYQWWLSDRATRESMGEWWIGHGAEDDKEAVGWWKVRIACRLTRVLSAEQVLRTALGSRWKATLPTMFRLPT